MMDIIVGNLVREGINKHRARELAEHFIKHISPPRRKEPEQEPWECVCGANLYIDVNGVPRSKASVEPATVMFKPEQEPVAWRHDMGEENGGWEYFEQASCSDCQPLYTTSPQRKPLSDEEIDALSREMVKGNKSVNWLCRAIEAAHGIKGKA